jgi:NhaB family Na+:H+ antiporter
MHAAVGTAFGGVITQVGEPQNLIIAERMGWGFGDFIINMMPVWACVLPCAVVTCFGLECSHRFGYGTEMPFQVRLVLEDFADKEYGKLHGRERAELYVQAFGALLLCAGLVLHFAEVGFVGLMVVVIVTSLNGVTEEHDIAHAFLESMPFVSLLVVFFGIVGMIHDQHLFAPVIEFVLGLDEDIQPGVLFIVNGVLSMVSDNVFVATVFVEEIDKHFKDEDGNFLDSEHGQELFEKLGVAICAGTNLPSLATPNGQAALLFILTSNIAPLVHLSYRKMCLMVSHAVLPYLQQCEPVHSSCSSRC